MYQLLPFFFVLVAGLFFTEVFRKMHLPIVVALIAAGAVIGPFGFELIETDPTLDFIGRIGLVFLMFIAGLEVKLSGFRSHLREISWMSLLNGLIPFLAGALVIWALGFSLESAIFVGIVFVSSSVAIITSGMAGLGLTGSRLGVTSIGSAVVLDIASLLVLAVMLQNVAPTTEMPLLIFYTFFALVVLVLYFLIPKIHFLLRYLSGGEKSVFESEIRLIFIALIGIVIIFESFGIHDIVAGFFAGLVLSESVTSSSLKNKLQTVGYGFFVPIFFILIGMKTDTGIFVSTPRALVLLVSLLAVLIVTKSTSGYLAGRIAGFRQRESWVMGVATTSQLFTTLAVVYTGREIGVIPAEISSALVVLSMATTVLAPLLINAIGRPLVLTKQEKRFIEEVRS